jgi:hypothetical protein
MLRFLSLPYKSRLFREADCFHQVLCGWRRELLNDLDDCRMCLPDICDVTELARLPKRALLWSAVLCRR